MKKLAILILVLMLVMPIVAQDNTSLAVVNGSVIKMIHDWEGSVGYLPQEPEAKTQWVIQDTHKLLLQSFHQRYQEDYLELIKAIRKTESLIHKDMPAEAKFNEQLQAFVIPKPKEEKK